MYKFYSRYVRHLILPNIGFKGQDLLKQSRVLCIGAGGLGSPALIYMASAGIGHIDIVDFDIVNITNLNRQIIFNQLDIGKNKALCAKIYLSKLNPTIKIQAYKEKISIYNFFTFIEKYDLIIDCTDNLESKFLINDAAIKYNIPVIHSSVFGLEGYITIFSKNTYCYRCLYNNFFSTNYLNYGILGPVAGIFGSLQALIAIKLLLYNSNIKTTYILFNKIIFIDFNSFKFDILTTQKNSQCNTCS